MFRTEVHVNKYGEGWKAEATEERKSSRKALQNTGRSARLRTGRRSGNSVVGGGWAYRVWCGEGQGVEIAHI